MIVGCWGLKEPGTLDAPPTWGTFALLCDLGQARSFSELVTGGHTQEGCWNLLGAFWGWLSS